MKKLQVILIVLLCASLSYGQNFTVDPIPTLVEGNAGIQPLIAFADIINHTEESQLVRWERIVEDIPDGWYSHICTPLGCYPEDISIGDFPMIPLEDLNIDVQFDTHGIPGTGYVEVKIFFDSDTSDYVIGIYESNALSVNVTEKEARKISISPNPCKEYCYINNTDQNIEQYEIYDVFGAVAQIGPFQSDKIAIDALSPGMYYITLYDSIKNRVEVLPFIKN